MRPSVSIDSLSGGFTLLEVMVALVIVSLGMMAVITQLNTYVSTAAYIEDKMLASWVATNILTELSIAPEWPELGDSEQDVDFGRRSWRARIEVSETDVTNLRRVDVEVGSADAPERTLHSVSGLIEPPPPSGFGAPRWAPDAAGGTG